MLSAEGRGICEEYDVCRVFDFLNLREPPDRFEVYRDPALYMTERNFLRVTGGAGATHTFRRIMREVEREYPINETPKLSSFALRAPAPKEPSQDGSYPAFLFFLRTAIFWDRLGKIRDPRFEPLPLVVLNAPSEVTEAKSFPIPVKGKVIFEK